jgi:hypothetical protein
MLDNEGGTNPAADPVVQQCLAAADTVVRFPPRVSIERALLQGVPDTEIVRVFRELDLALEGLSLPVGWDALTGAALIRTLAKLMHDRTGSIHAIYVEALDSAQLPPVALRALLELHQVATQRGPSGLVSL